METTHLQLPAQSHGNAREGQLSTIRFSSVALSVRTIEAERHREFNAAQPSVSFLQTPARSSEWRSEPRCATPT